MIKKIPISKIVEFNRKSPKGKQTFINNLKKNKPKEEPGKGGNYWVHSLSTVARVFISESKAALDERIMELNGKRAASKKTNVKDMFQRNIEIVQNFKDIDISSLKPGDAFKQISKSDSKSILKVHEVPIQALPHHVFTFEENDTKKLGAIWFVAKIHGYKIGELGMFSEALHHYLVFNYASRFIINPEYCIAMDVIKLNHVRYSQLASQEVPSLLDKSLDAIRTLL